MGTDYAAPYGTPILAIGDGVVLEATRRGGNGNFVKSNTTKPIRHNTFIRRSFCTRYSSGCSCKTRSNHWLCRINRPGNGSARLFSFLEEWKAGQPFEPKLPSTGTTSAETMPEFEKVKNAYLEQLDALPFAELTKDEDDKENLKKGLGKIPSF
ncbi:MAG: M23 family metallopeptidase [Saprospiraceae bacterium]